MGTVYRGFCRSGLPKMLIHDQSGVFDGPTNMALDAALLDRPNGGLRVYGWSHPWVSLGRFQRPEKILLNETTPYVMRPTGGKAVLHGHDVTVGLALPYGQIGVDGPRQLGRAYRIIIEVLISALRELGHEVDLAERTRWVHDAGRVADCFAHVAPIDVVCVDSGQKVVGCALKMAEKAVLVQASIPSGPPLVDPATVMRGTAPYGWINLSREDLIFELTRIFANRDQEPHIARLGR